jgi:hypothetical protein
MCVDGRRGRLCKFAFAHHQMDKVCMSTSSDGRSVMFLKTNNKLDWVVHTLDVGYIRSHIQHFAGLCIEWARRDTHSELWEGYNRVSIARVNFKESLPAMYVRYLTLLLCAACNDT